MYVIKAEECSMEEWVEYCSFNPQFPLVRLDVDKLTIVFLYVDELELIKRYLNGTLNRCLKDELFSSVEKDVLGDVDNFDINEEPQFEYFDISVDINDVVDTRGATFHYHNKFGKIQNYEDKNGNYEFEYYSHRKGFPSFMFKIWDNEQEKWVE